MKTDRVRVLCSKWLAALVVAAGGPCAAQTAGRIVVVNDGVTIMGQGFVPPGDAGAFAVNIAAWFTDGAPGSFLTVTSFAVNSPELAGAMAAAGHQWASTASPASLTLTALQQYDGLFVAAVPADSQLLIDYVLGGGNVYVAAGTGGFGSAASEAAAWNPFLEQFGLRFHDVWNTALLTAVPVSETHDIFEDVDHLWTDLGQGIFDLHAGNPANRVFVPVATEPVQGHFGVFDGSVCHADCNGDGALTVADFGCFQTKFVAGDPYGDCDGVNGLTVQDFGCFQTKFVTGCQ